MAERITVAPVIDTGALYSRRWVWYLLLAVFGSTVGGLIISVFYLAGVMMVLGPVGVLAGMAIAATITFIWLPIYALIAAFVGLRLNKRHAISILGIKLVPGTDLETRVHRLAALAGLPRPPSVGLYESPVFNALATGSGRKSSLVAFTTTAVSTCTPDELDAVAAHEIAHIANGDMVALNVVSSVQGAMTWYMLFAGLRSFLRRTLFFVTELGAAGLSRRREYRADAVAAALAGKDATVRVLRHLESAEKQEARLSRRERRYAMLMIFDNKRRTHPKTELRIAAVDSGKYAHTVPLARQASAAPTDEKAAAVG